jgi:hypothetical protein
MTLGDEVPAIKAAAEALRPGHTVAVEVPALDGRNDVVADGVMLNGGLNVHLPMEWDDGVRWLARIKTKKIWNPEVPDAQVRDEVENEFANLAVARRLLGPLVYQAWLPPAPVCKSRRGVADAANLHLTFVERVDGVALEGRVGDWKPDLSSDDAVARAAKAVLASFPDILKKIAAEPFSGMGSFWGQAKPTLGGMARDDAPSATFADYALPRIHKTLDDLQSGTVTVLYSHPGLFYLSFLELRDLIAHDRDMTTPEPMYLHHGDEWQLLLSHTHTQVQSIIDWERYASPSLR